MNSDASLVTGLLKSTSRSFYLSLRILPPSMRPAAAIGYLLCRTVDSIADTDIIPPSERLRALNHFFDLLDRFPGRTEEWTHFCDELTSINQNPHSAEGALLGHLAESMEYFRALFRTDQVLVQRVVQGVIQGMRLDLKFFGSSGEGVTAFQNKETLEKYLIWIGGEPGRFWSDLTLAHHSRLPIPNVTEWREDGIIFGTGLQMVNILRDVGSDLTLGRCYIPIELLKEQGLEPAGLLEPEAYVKLLPLLHRLIDGTLDRLEHGLKYLRVIPKRMVSLRLAVWWPLVFGVQTLGKIRGTYHVLDPKKRAKISRWQVYWNMTISLPLIFSNGGMEGVFRRMRKKAAL